MPGVSRLGTRAGHLDHPSPKRERRRSAGRATAAWRQHRQPPHPPQPHRHPLQPHRHPLQPLHTRQPRQPLHTTYACWTRPCVGLAISSSKTKNVARLTSLTSSSWRPSAMSGRGAPSCAAASAAGVLTAADAPLAIDNVNPTTPAAGTTSFRILSLDKRGTALSIDGVRILRVPCRRAQLRQAAAAYLLPRLRQHDINSQACCCTRKPIDRRVGA